MDDFKSFLNRFVQKNYFWTRLKFEENGQLKDFNPKLISDPIVQAIIDKRPSALDEKVKDLATAVVLDEKATKVANLMLAFEKDLEKFRAEMARIYKDRPQDGKPGLSIKGDPGDTPKKYVDYFTDKEIASISKDIEKSVLNSIVLPKDGYTPQRGLDYPSADQIEGYIKALIQSIPDPKDGFTPAHRWEGTSLQFQNPDGTWGEKIDLKGKDAQGRFMGGGFATEFTDLSDVPHSYSGKSLMALRVKADESGLEFYTPGGGSGAVDSVNGYTGVVVLDTSDIAATTNKNYVTDAHLTALGSLASDLAAKEDTANKGTAGGYASLDGSGKIPSSQLPAIAITTSAVVASQAAQLALTAQEGDVAIRSDINKSYIHNGGVSGTMADWYELLTPTDTVLSVNGETGAVTLTTDDISDSGQTNKWVTAGEKADIALIAGKADDADVVHITGDEDIAGKKHFSDGIADVNNDAVIVPDSNIIYSSGAGSPAISINWDARMLYDLSAQNSLSWLNRVLYDTSSNPIFSWEGVYAKFIDPSSSAEAVIDTNILSGNRQYQLPDADGVIALQSDIPTVPSNLFSRDVAYVTSGTGDYTPGNASYTDYFILMKVGRDILLPIAGGGGGQLYYIKNDYSASITVTPDTGDNIDGSASAITLQPQDCIILQAESSTSWSVLGLYSSTPPSGSGISFKKALSISLMRI